MITLVEGALGAGKTIYAVRESLRHCAVGGTVYTNVDMVFGECRRYVRMVYGVTIKRGQIVRLPECEDTKDWWKVVEWGTLEKPTLCVLDEAHMNYNARDWANTAKNEKDMLSFLTQSRKAGVDVMIITQSKGNVDKQFREMAELVVLARNMAKVRVPGLGLPLPGIIRFSRTEVKKDFEIDFEWWRIDRRLFRCYKTEAFLDSLMRALAAGRRRKPPERMARVSLVHRVYLKWASLGGSDKFLADRLLRPLIARNLKRQRRNARDSDFSGPGGPVLVGRNNDQATAL